MNKFFVRSLYGLACAVLVYAGAVIYFDMAELSAALAGFPWWTFGVALALSSANYLLRFAKWELALGWLGIRQQAPELTLGRSLLIYLAGLSMSISPGKVGEVLRSLLLRASDDVPFTRTAPIVVADRLTDLIALVLLSLVSVTHFREHLEIMLATVALLVAAIVVLGSPTLLHRTLRILAKLPKLGALAHRAEMLVESTAVLLRLRVLVVLTILSVIGWGLECVAYWLVVSGLVGEPASVGLCTFLWAAGTLIGALSFLPGGLGATEGSLVYMTQTLVVGATQSVALAAAFLSRVATLWFGEIVGGIALALFLRDDRVRARMREVTREGG